MTENQPTRPATEPVSLERLLATYTAWSSADVVETARRRAFDAGDTDRAAVLEAMAGRAPSPTEALAGRAPSPTEALAGRAPSPTEALAAAHELGSLLAGWRWHRVRAARDAGASWDDIAAATGTDPATARAEFLGRVQQASEQAVAAGFEFRDEQRYRDAAQPDRTDAQDPDEQTPQDIHRLDPGSSTMTDDLQQRGEVGPVRAPAGWPVPDLSRPLAEVSDRELITRAELDEAVAMTGVGGDPDAAGADLDATRAEAERRALDQPPDSVPAQVAGYIALVSDDHTGALHAEATSWRRDLDQALPPADTTSAAAAAAPRSIAENAAGTGARMSAEPPSDSPPAEGAGFDLERLDEVTEQFGYAVFDPDAPGGVRAPTEREYADLLTELTPTARTTNEHPTDTTVSNPHDVTKTVAGVAAPGWPGTAEAQVDEVARRTANPAFGYDPAAEWGDATYREPRTQGEADARTAHLEAQRAAQPPAPRPPMRALTEVEAALEDAELDAELSHRAHDLDPEPAARVAGLEALQNLRPAPTQEPDPIDGVTGRGTPAARYSGPEVEFEDQLFRRSLEHTVPANVHDREQTIERAVDVARDRFWTHGLTTYPDQALALSQNTDDGTDGDSGDPARLRDLLEQTRAQLAARDTADSTATQSGEAERREQLLRWHHDDHNTDHTTDHSDHGVDDQVEQLARTLPGLDCDEGAGDDPGEQP